MCVGGYCIRRGAELHMTDGCLNVPPPRQYTDDQRTKKCLREFAWWIYLILLMGVNFSIWFFHKDFTVIRLATIVYGFLLISGFTLWWKRREFGYDNLGLATFTFIIIWCCCATLGISHIINLTCWTIKLQNNKREFNVHEDYLLSVQNSNDTKADV